MIRFNEPAGATIQIRDTLIYIERAELGAVRLMIDDNGDGSTVRRSGLLERMLRERGYHPNGEYWIDRRGNDWTLRDVLLKEGMI